MSNVVLRILERADGQPDDRCDGLYVREYSPHGFDGRGKVVVTNELERACVFDDVAAALTCWNAVSYTHPRRPDGLPNRPLTAFTVEVLPRHGAQL
jgi:hypothetical protein